MKERGPPAEWAGQDSPGTNPFDAAKKGAKKGNRRERARSQARSKERPLPDSAKRPALPSGPAKFWVTKFWVRIDFAFSF